MKLEVEMTEEQLNLLILSTEIYGRILMNQPDLVADIIAEDRFFYDKNDPENDRRFHEWIKDRDEMTEKLRMALNVMFHDSYKSDTCRNLIDIWRVLRHLQYNIFYLLANDVWKALGCKSIEQLQGEYPEIVKHIKDLPALVLECDFNTILTSDIEAMKKLKHIEITRVETLRNNTEAIKSIYPLKFMVAGKMFEDEAKNAGFQSISEYIEEVDLVKEIENEKEKLVSKGDVIECINHSRKQLSELIDIDVLEKNDLQIQQYIHIKECTPYLESFIVGRGIFFSVYDDGYVFDELKVENYDLIIPTFDYDEEDPNKNYGHDPDMRDYREYSCLENILYLITHKNVEDAGVDLMCCDAPGISFYISQTEVIKLLNPNIYRDVVLIDGDIDFAYSKTITKDIYTE